MRENLKAVLGALGVGASTLLGIYVGDYLARIYNESYHPVFTFLSGGAGLYTGLKVAIPFVMTGDRKSYKNQSK